MNTYNCSVGIHGKYHIELKAEYPLIQAGDKNQTQYEMEFCFFFPSQLCMTRKRIGTEEFLRNLKTYTRFSTPSLSLEKLLDPSCRLSPLGRIKEILSYSELEKPDMLDSLLYELRMLVNMYRAEIQGIIELVRDEIKQSGMSKVCRSRIKQLLADITVFMKEFRAFHTSFLDPHIADLHRKALNWADESVSIITEQGMVELFPFCSKMGADNSLCREIEALTEQETAYRKSMDFQYLFNRSDRFSGERMAYRDSILKKWSQSALYMNSADSGTPKRIGHILAGTAAGVAMVFAVLVSIFADKIFIRNSMPWAFLIVLSYIFKDRIKEILREILGRFLPRVTADQQTILTDPSTGQRVGISQGLLHFSKAGSVPEAIYKERYYRLNPFRDILPEEDTVYFKKIIKIQTRKLKSSHTRLRGITEILRISIDDWLREMDDPKNILYRLEDGKRIKIKGNRVYNIHLVVSLKERRRGETELYHYRIVINKSGLLRIEAVHKG